jgi:hypothetical protein
MPFWIELDKADNDTYTSDYIKSLLSLVNSNPEEFMNQLLKGIRRDNSFGRYTIPHNASVCLFPPGWTHTSQHNQDPKSLFFLYCQQNKIQFSCNHIGQFGPREKRVNCFLVRFGQSFYFTSGQASQVTLEQYLCLTIITQLNLPVFKKQASYDAPIKEDHYTSQVGRTRQKKI